MMNPIRLASSNSAHALLRVLAADFSRQHGIEVSLVADTADGMVARLKGRELADAVVMNAPYFDELVEAGVIEAHTRQPFAISRIGVAVRKGTPHPDISSVDALTQALLDAQTVAHTVHGASGMYVPTLLRRLGIADQVRTVTRPGGLIGEVVAAGEAEIAVQQTSELLAVAGVEVVGLLPDAVQKTFVSSAGVAAASKQREAAAKLLLFFADPANAKTFQAAGLEQSR